MRFDFNIVWLDDDWESELSRGNLEYTEEIIKQHLFNLGYNAKITRISKKEDIGNIVNDRTDLFLSDYNLSSDFKGIDFLKILREKLSRQEVLIYTNGGIDEIRRHLHKILDESAGMQILQKFSFSETRNLENNIIRIISMIVDKVSELNMLRGLYTSEIGKIEEKITNVVLDDYKNELRSIRKKNGDETVIGDFIREQIICKKKKCETHLCYYENLNSRRIESLVDSLNMQDFKFKLDIFLKKYPQIQKQYPEFYNTSNEIRKLRNILAHGKEEFDIENKKYCIPINKTDKIYDSDIKKLRIKLKDYLNLINLIFSEIGGNYSQEKIYQENI